MRETNPADPLVAADLRIQPEPLEALELEAASFGISVAKLLANRANAKQSCGPKSTAGKLRSSLNSTRHSLTGQLVCKTQEELEAQQKFTAQLMAEWRPEGPTELARVIAIAENEIRLARVRQLEDGIFASGFRDRVDAIESGHPQVDAALAHSGTFLEHAKSISLLGTYESRIRKGLREDRADLKAMQAERKAAYNEAREEAVKLAYYVEQGQEEDPEYDPASHFEPAEAFGGFVYDATEVAAWETRKARSEAARKFYRPLILAPAPPNSGPSGPKTGLAA